MPHPFTTSSLRIDPLLNECRSSNWLTNSRCFETPNERLSYVILELLSHTGFGDIPFKQPPAFTRRVLYNLFPGFHNTSPWEEFLVKNITPPYITAEPQIIHRGLNWESTGSTSATKVGQVESSITRTVASFAKNFFWPSRSAESQTVNPLPKFLILASDGFADICSDADPPSTSNKKLKQIVASWAYSMSLVRPPMTDTDSVPWSTEDNMALRLLRRAIGGEDRPGVSKVLTLDMDGAWIDDTSIVVMTI